MLLDGVNNKMVLYQGLTIDELAFAFIATLLGSLLSCTLIFKLLLGSLLLGLLCSLVLSMALLRPMIGITSRLKRGKPRGFICQWLHLKAHQAGLIKAPFIQLDGQLSIGRYQ